MKISRKGEYALRALMELARETGGNASAHSSTGAAGGASKHAAAPKVSLRLREISERSVVPVKFLEQIMILLKRARFVRSTRGKQGGYVLARPAKEIIVGEVIRSLDGSLAPLGDAEEFRERLDRRDHFCGLYATLLDVRNAVCKIMDHRSIQDLCERSEELERTFRDYPMYYI